MMGVNVPQIPSSANDCVLPAPVLITVLEASAGALTKRYGPTEDGKVKRTAGADLLKQGRATRSPFGSTVMEALERLQATIKSLRPSQAFMTGLPPDGRLVWEIVGDNDARLDQGRGVISRTQRFFSAVSGPAFVALDFDLKEYPPHIKKRLSEAGGLEAVMCEMFPAIRQAARLVAPSASSFIKNTSSGFCTGQSGEHWYLVVEDGTQTKTVARLIAERLEAAGWCWGHVTKNGTVVLKTLIDAAATAPERVLYEAPPMLEPGLELTLEKAPRLVPGDLLRVAPLASLTEAEQEQRKDAVARAKAAVADIAAETKATWRRDRVAKLIERGVSAEKAERSTASAADGELMGDDVILFDDNTSATVREILGKTDAFDGKTCPDPIEPEYGSGRNLAVLQLNYPPQIYSHAHGGMTYRLGLDPNDYFDVVTASPIDEAHAKLADEMFGAMSKAGDVTRQFSAWSLLAPETVPRIQFVYGDDYAAGYLSVTFAAPKTGKSLLAIAEAIDAATGRGFLTGQKGRPQRVLYFNAEDDQAVLNARTLAVLQAYGIPQSEIEGRFFVVSGVSEESQIVLLKGEKHEVQEVTFSWLTSFIRNTGITLAIFDPLQDLSQSPETNEAFRALGGRIRRLAHDTGAAIGLVHHTRKPSPGLQPTLDDGRGGSALRGVARFNRLLVPMTETEGAQAGVQDHRLFFRIAELESNLAPPSSERNRWFEKLGVPIGNGGTYPTIRPWAWPEVFSGVTPSDAAQVRAAIVERTAKGNPPRGHQNAEDWAGKIVAKVLGIDLDGKLGKANRSRVSVLIKAWLDAGYLALEHRGHGDKGKASPFIVPGPKAPETVTDVFG